MQPTTEQPLTIALPESNEAAPADTVSSEENEFGINWTDYAGEQGQGETEIETVEGDIEVPVNAKPEEPKVVAPATASVSTPAPAPVVPPVPPVPPVTQAPPVQTPSPAHTLPSAAAPEPAPSQIPTVPVQPTLDIGAVEQEQLKHLQTFYAINEEDSNLLQTEPENVLPKLAANMHLAITKSSLAAIQAMLPQMLAQHTQQISIEQKARDEFFTANPDLMGYDEQVLQVGKMFRAANPTATKEQAVKMIGDMVRMSMGLPLQTAASAPVTSPVAPSAPAPAQVMPFMPSKAGGSAGSPIKSPNMWEQLIDDD